MRHKEQNNRTSIDYFFQCTFDVFIRKSEALTFSEDHNVFGGGGENFDLLTQVPVEAAVLLTGVVDG